MYLYVAQEHTGVSYMTVTIDWSLSVTIEVLQNSITRNFDCLK